MLKTEMNFYACVQIVTLVGSVRGAYKSASNAESTANYAYGDFPASNKLHIICVVECMRTLYKHLVNDVHHDHWRGHLFSNGRSEGAIEQVVGKFDDAIERTIDVLNGPSKFDTSQCEIIVLGLLNILENGVFCRAPADLLSENIPTLKKIANGEVY